jgi:cytochrome bd-type quinol oxidase subunit 1
MVFFELHLQKNNIMFSTGQLVFTGIFIVGFVIALYFSYRNDKNLHQKFYKGSYKVLIMFFLFIIALFVIKKILKH